MVSQTKDVPRRTIEPLLAAAADQEDIRLFFPYLLKI
jgi:hypothetical protein